MPSPPLRIPEPPVPGRGDTLPSDSVRPVYDLVAQFARQTPDSIAVLDEDDRLSYADLAAAAGAVHGALHTAGVAPGDRVAVLAGPSAATVAAVLGVVRSGAAYVPIDPAQPDARVSALLSDAQVSAVLAAEDTIDRLGDAVVPVLSIAKALADGPAASAPAPAAVDERDAAYLIYTSGSTGEPKGVVVEHCQLAASTAARRQVYTGAAVFLLVSPLAFDSSVAGLWGTFTSGGCLVVAGTDTVRDPDRLLDLIARHGVTHMLCVPSLYSALLDTAERSAPGRAASLRTVIVAGEPLPQPLVERHFAQPECAELVNEYGPTEAAVWASYRRFSRPEPVSIGVPIPGARLYVLDDTLRPVEPGTPGELFIAGTGVARGYHGRPGASARSFIADPYAAEPGARMYRSGDLARWNADGTLEFLGRRDDQVKVRGHRIVLSAVEQKLQATAGVREAAVVFDRERGQVHGFVTAEPSASTTSIRHDLSARVAPAMVPARIHLLPALPLNVNGKVDRSRLRDLAERTGAAPGATRPPDAADELTGKIMAAWSEVLKLQPVPVDENFFDLGGDSLTMLKLQKALHRTVGDQLSTVALFQHTTVAAQAAYVRNRADTRPGAPAAGSLENVRRANAARMRQQRVRQKIQ